MWGRPRRRPLHYLVAFDFDELLGAVHDVEVLVLVVEGHVTGVQPAVLVYHLPRRLRVLVVALHHLEQAECVL